MADLEGQPGELRFTISITRAETGAVEHYDMVGKIVSDDDGDQTEPNKDDD